MKTYNQEEFIQLRDSQFYDSFNQERTSKYRDLEKFRKIFNKDFLNRMKLEDYVVGLGSTDSVKSKFSTNNFKKIRIPQFSETRFGSFVGLFSCFDVYKQ